MACITNGVTHKAIQADNAVVKAAKSTLDGKIINIGQEIPAVAIADLPSIMKPMTKEC
jgi:hypothetical protein